MSLTPNMLWRWFYRGVLGLWRLFAAFSVLLVAGMNRPLVTQSDGYTSITPDALAATISQALPETATKVRHRRASVGMGGRLLIYRFAAPLDDLHTHAQREFAEHWDRPQPAQVPSSPTPITDEDIALHKSAFGIDADWMLPPPGAIGTIYKSADDRHSHRPTIFIDETNGVLYFQMTD